jgi:hypothetical protein
MFGTAHAAEISHLAKRIKIASLFALWYVLCNGYNILVETGFSIWLPVGMDHCVVTDGFGLFLRPDR